MYKIIYILFPILLLSCKSDAQLAMERGIKLYDWNKLDDAIVEFNKVKYLLNYDGSESLASVELYQISDPFTDNVLLGISHCV